MSQVRKAGGAGRRGNMARNLMPSPPRLYAESQAARYAVCQEHARGTCATGLVWQVCEQSSVLLFQAQN